LTMAIGSHAEFTVGGGFGTRLVSSTNVAVATASFTDTAKTALKIDAIAAGSANIIIRDTFGSTPLTIAVTVPAATVVPGVEFFTNAPAAITLATGGTASFTLSGGSTPYSAVTDNSSVVTVSQPTTTTVLITGVAAGDATITLTDAVGKIKSVDVHVNPGAGAVALFTTSPAAISVELNTTQTYTIGGGTGTYTITNSNPSVATGTVTGAGPTGGTLKVHGLLIGTTAIRVFDGAGSSVPIGVTTIPPATALAILPATLSISEANTSGIDFTVSGGTAPYNFFTDNLVLSSVATSSGSVLRVTLGSQTTRCVTENKTITFTVVDAVGGTKTAQLTIVDDGSCAPP
jgi:hypothetical protein